MTLALMVQGTGSNVGKSLLVAGLCRAFTNRGYSVSPFKPQNMSNNSSVTPDCKEIGRAQFVQAVACKRQPSVDMNPVLLKPETDTGAQVVVRGHKTATLRASEYAKLKPGLLTTVIESFERLSTRSDIVIVEGAGSPAETNLRAGDIANMGFASQARIPVLLVGDIDRGGVIAQIVGTKAVIDEQDASLIRGFAINKFRGDPNLFLEGYRTIESLTGWRGIGILPWIQQARYLPAEDAYGIETVPSEQHSQLKISCLVLSRIANFDDLDPLRMHPGVTVAMIMPGEFIPPDSDLVIVPGSKSTRGDLEFIRKNGWDHDLISHQRRGGHVLGICGGYQMLGREVNDPQGVDGLPGSSVGLGLLDVSTEMRPVKRVTRSRARCPDGQTEFEAYEIHAGETLGTDNSRPFAMVHNDSAWIPEGAISGNGRVKGTYLHGLFANDAFRQHFLNDIRSGLGTSCYSAQLEQTLDDLSEHIEEYLDLQSLISIMERGV